MPPQAPLGGRQPHASAVFFLPKLVCDALDRACPDAERLGEVMGSRGAPEGARFFLGRAPFPFQRSSFASFTSSRPFLELFGSSPAAGTLLRRRLSKRLFEWRALPLSREPRDGRYRRVH
jgi:hypothetical protein